MDMHGMDWMMGGMGLFSLLLLVLLVLGVAALVKYLVNDSTQNERRPFYVPDHSAAYRLRSGG
jgi:hypothetical protein